MRIKSEKNSLNANIVTLQTSLDNKGKELKSIEKVCKELKIEVKKVSSLESKITNLVKDKECAEIMVENLVSEKKLKSLKEYSCILFDKRYKSKVELKGHVQKDHYKSQLSQCNSFNDSKKSCEAAYQCFYCDKTITSRETVQEHRKTCHETRKPTKTIFSFCNPGPRKSIDKREVKEHLDSFHIPPICFTFSF